MDNPYIPMFDWLREEEIDIEAMVEAISSLHLLYENQEKLGAKVLSLDQNIKNIKTGKKSLKSIFSFKSPNEECNALENEKHNCEKAYQDLEMTNKLATYNMDSYIEYFKVEKLAGYYQNLKIFADLQKLNSIKINDLWQTVGSDKNIQKLISK